VERLLWTSSWPDGPLRTSATPPTPTPPPAGSYATAAPGARGRLLTRPDGTPPPCNATHAAAVAVRAAPNTSRRSPPTAGAAAEARC
jgi:hypothetical protein